MSTKKKITTPKASRPETAKGVAITDPLVEPPLMDLSPIDPIVWENYAIRTFGTPENVWFLAKDVCIALGITNATQAVRGNAAAGAAGLDTDEVAYLDSIKLADSRQKALIINESGFNSLIFKSRKPEARAIQKWLTSEVMPALRRGGKYDPTPMLEAPPSPPQLTLRDGIEFMRRKYRQIQDETVWLRSKIEESNVEVAEAMRRRDGLKDQLGEVEQKMRGQYNQIERILIPLREIVRANAGTVIYTSQELDKRVLLMAETATFQQ